MVFLDPHSFTDADQPLVKSVALELKVDFKSKTIAGTAEYILKSATRGVLDFDIRHLIVETVIGADGKSVTFEADQKDEIKGARLRMHVQGTWLCTQVTNSMNKSQLIVHCPFITFT